MRPSNPQNQIRTLPEAQRYIGFYLQFQGFVVSLSFLAVFLGWLRVEPVFAGSKMVTFATLCGALAAKLWTEYARCRLW
jgi:hypothetical protein